MDRQLIQQLYESYGKELLLYLYSICGSYSLSEDLLQETFVKAILSLSMQHTNMRAWLYRVARNLYFNTAKKEKSRAKAITALTAHPQAGPAHMQLLPSPGILENLLEQERSHMLQDALQRLAPLKREILQLQYVNGMPLKEIASILQVSPENARVLSHRAKRELKKILEEEGYGIP